MDKQRERKSRDNRSERRPVQLHGFALSGERDADVVISDLSYEGCRLQSEQTFEPGEVVELRIVRRGRITAQICWAEGGAAGARFLA